MPVVTQYASPQLIAKIVYEGHDPGDDPRWTETGAGTSEEYGRWCRHMCGMACLQMTLLHRDGIAPSLFQLLAGAREADAYVEHDNGDIKGLIYAPAADWMRSAHGLSTAVHPTLTVEELTALLDAGRMVMASVSKDIRTPDVQPSRRGGHLVLCRGRTPEGQIAFSNPSGHTPEALAPTLPIDRFAAFFGERGISLDLRPA
ncbi:C39 family peptidase [Streptomyces sp. NPDC059875]|uniref:C39 family peptidase n=1 Tax=unclassified Streptomyces TaxID=2593676 RepID=UPI003669F0F1